MTTISIIGSGNMATAIGTRAAKHGHTIEVMSRDTAKAQHRSTWSRWSWPRTAGSPILRRWRPST